MLRFQFYLPDGQVAPDTVDLADLVSHIPGVSLEPGTDYRPGIWHAVATGARALLDVGEPPIESDHMHPPRQYLGWTPLPLVVQLPLVGPHWQAVEGFQFIEAVLAGLPSATRALDCEDIQETPQAEPGPFAWSRPRVLASWERQHAVQIETRTDLARMHRGDSLRLWRWRRERAAASAVHPTMQWPEARVLRDRSGLTAHPTAVWTDPTRPAALPGAGLILVLLPEGPRLVERKTLPPGEALPTAGASLLQPPAHWPESLDQTRYAACLDEDWVD
jgi:hypothetical protein